MRKSDLIIESLGHINESKIRNYDLQLYNIKKERLNEFSKFIGKLESFARYFLPKMDDNMMMSVDVSEIVGSGIVFTVYIYGYDKFVEDEFEFDRLYNKNSMESHIGNLMKISVGPYESIFASTYWNSKIEVGKKKIKSGPYVEIRYSGDSVYDS